MSRAPNPERVSFLGVQFDNLNESRAIQRIKRMAREPSFQYVVTPNVDHVVRLHSEPRGSNLWASYSNCSMSLCDSRVLHRLAWLSGTKLSVVPGSDLTARLLSDHLDAFGVIAIIGSDAGFIADLRRMHPRCAWHHHVPPMGVRDDREAQEEIIRFVEQSDADLLLFAIGSPQSELLCEEIRRRGAARGLALCIGASLEFASGVKRRAPRWMQRVGLEWLFRLVSEPRRLWRRYLVKGPAIFRLWWKWQFSPVYRREACGSTPSGES